MAHTPGPWTVHPTGAQIVGGRDGMTSVCNTFATHWRHSAERMSNLRVKQEFSDMAAEHADNARLVAAAPELLAELRAVTHLAKVLNNRQHAGLPITPAMWSELFQITNRAEAVIDKAEG